MPYLLHKNIDKPKEYRQSIEPNLKTFIDDSLIKVNGKPDKNLIETVKKVIDKVEEYAACNKLCLNPEKSQVMVITKKKEIKDNFNLEVNKKIIKHSPQIKVLEIILEENLMWDEHAKRILIPELTNRVKTFKKISKYLGNNFKKVYSNSIFRSKLLYGIESWGGMQQTQV